jgi:hypothetical protein
MRRRIPFALLGAACLVLLASPAAAADVWANVGPASSLSGLASRYPLGNYALDEHFTAISAGVFSGVDVSGLLPMIAYFFANELWQLTAWLANLVVELFAFAFSLDLVNGSSATNGAGALGPVSRAISSIYSDVFGGPWMVLAVSVAGCWAMWKALVQRRYAETAGQLALSLVYVGIAFLFVLQPAQTIGTASHWTNEMSGAFLSIAKDGEPVSQGEAKEAGADQIFGLLVAQPWSVLEFGGLDHCVKAGGGEEAESVAVQPLPDGAARRLEFGEQVSAGGKSCVDNLKRYGPHFLRFEPGSKEREEEVEALEDGDSSKLPDADPGKKSGAYELGPIDTPAAQAMEKGGQYQRLLVAIVVFCAELGAFVLLGALSIGVITAQVLLLLLLAFSPVALVAAAVPGRGHQFFKGWLAKLAGFLLRKAAYSLVLAVLLAVCAAISAATSELGWLLSFGLQCAFFWAVFLQRKSLTEGLIGTVTGPGVPGRDRALGAVALYMGARTGTRLAGRPFRAARSTFGGRRRETASRRTGPGDDRAGGGENEVPRSTSGAPEVEATSPKGPKTTRGTERGESRRRPSSGGIGDDAPGRAGRTNAGREPDGADGEAGRRDRGRGDGGRPDGSAETRRPGKGRTSRKETDDASAARRQGTTAGPGRRPTARKPGRRRAEAGPPPPTTPPPPFGQADLADGLRSDTERLGERASGAKPASTDPKPTDGPRADRPSSPPRGKTGRPHREDGRR